MYEGSSAAAPPPSSSSAIDPGVDVGEGSLSSFTRELPFSSGNPMIEETRGIMHLFRDDVAPADSSLPASMYEGSSAAAAPPSSSSAIDPGVDVGEGSLSSFTRELPFSSGNPMIEETRGIMHLFRDDVAPADSSLPIERKPLVCVLGVPNHMTYADFCQFCGSFIQHVLEMRIVRINDMDGCYSVLIRFDGQDSTNDFHKHFNGQKYSSLEVETCHVLFMIDVLYTGSIEHKHPSVVNSTDQPNCPVCLEKLGQDSSGILVTICNHSFHCSCISKWTDSSCPVCRYCQQQPEKSVCIICQTSENLWMCVICGFVGCGRYKEGHAITHWKETDHCYSLEVGTQRVWDYAGDNYVERLIQSKTGKLVEINSRCPHPDCDNCGCSEDPAFREAIWESRAEAIKNEYNELLQKQLEAQRGYYESLLKDLNDEIEMEAAEAAQKAISSKCDKLQTKLKKCVEEKEFHDQIHENLLANQEILQRQIKEAEERKQRSVQEKDNKISALEKELAMLLASFGSDDAVPKEDCPLPEPAASSSGQSGKKAQNKKGKNRKK